MTLELQIILLIGSIIALFFVLWTVVKNKMNIHYAMVWILWGIGVVILALFPGLTISLTKLIGIEVPVNTVFLVMITLLYAFSFYVFLKLSKQNEEIINLNYEIAVLKKKVEDLEKKND